GRGKCGAERRSGLSQVDPRGGPQGNKPRRVSVLSRRRPHSLVQPRRRKALTGTSLPASPSGRKNQTQHGPFTPEALLSFIVTTGHCPSCCRSALFPCQQL